MIAARPAKRIVLRRSRLASSLKLQISRTIHLGAVLVAAYLAVVGPVYGQQDNTPAIKVHRCDDFEVDGEGTNEAWNGTEWVPLNRRFDGRIDFHSRFKMLYSKTGIYVLFDGDDRKLSATIEEDFADLWHEDVFECFFWTDERDSLYFEYEISPLGYELPILIPNLEGQFLGWRPWHYEGDRKTRKATSVLGGEKKPHAKIDRWRAEIFIPYKLLSPLRSVPPQPGTTWRANFYRVDYDDESAMSWDWARVGSSFHEFKKFGTIEFVE